MKKYKLMSPVLATATVMAPASCITSCSNVYDEMASLIQEDILDIFADFSSGDMDTMHKPCHRRTFACGDIFKYIQDKMATNGYREPSGYDKWTDIPEVKAEQEKIGAASESYGNIWYDIEPTVGCERWTPIMIQSHYDMTLQFDSSKESAAAYWQQYGVEYKIDYENETMWTESLHSGGPGQNYMSLGADGGIGIAFMLTLAQSNINSMFRHGPIRLMFTADEGGPTEHFQTGAHLLVQDDKVPDEDGKGYWTNPKTKEVTEIIDFKDSERPFVHKLSRTGQLVSYLDIVSVAALNAKYIYQSAAGIHECVISHVFNENDNVFEIVRQEGDKRFFKITVSGLYGGHSAEDINDGIANALDLLFETVADDDSIEIISVASGDNPYRIPNEATIRFASTKTLGQWQAMCDTKRDEFKRDWKVDGERIKVDVQALGPVGPAPAIINEKSKQLVYFINKLYYGPQIWYDPSHKEVETSVNFCPLTITTYDSENPKMNFDFHITCRSGTQSNLSYFSNIVHGWIAECVPWLGTSLVHIETAVWQKEQYNPIVDLMYEAYKVNKNNAELKNCHGWFEIACLSEITIPGKAPHLVCVGPTIYDAHTNLETLYFDSMAPFIKGILYTFTHANTL